MRESHNRVEAAVCLYARMVDKENLWLVLYALKVHPLPPSQPFAFFFLSFCLHQWHKFALNLFLLLCKGITCILFSGQSGIKEVSIVSNQQLSGDTGQDMYYCLVRTSGLSFAPVGVMLFACPLAKCTVLCEHGIAQRQHALC